MRLNETGSTVSTGKHLSDMFPTQNGLKHGDALTQPRYMLVSALQSAP